jgi:hypothetical protein
MNLDPQQEEWKAIEDVPEYAVSNLGRVKRLKDGVNTYPGRMLKLRKNKFGYVIAQLSHSDPNKTDKKKKVWRTAHRLVLEAFVSKRPKDKDGCNHIDGDKANNNLINLEWVTHSENELHAHRIGLKDNGLGETSFNSKLKNNEVWLIKKLLANKVVTQRAIAKMFKVHFATINHINRGITWSHITCP